MSILDGIAVVAGLCALGFLARLAWKKAPQVSLVDPMSSREAKAKERKQAILEERMVRQAQERGRVVWQRLVAPVVKTFRDGFRRFAGRLTALERRYVERQRGGTLDAHALNRMVLEAKHAMSIDRYDLAEQTLVAIVSHDPKHIEAYETLAHMYMTLGRYEEAKETMEFLTKLSPKDASVMVGLGEVYEAMGDRASAFGAFTKGKELSPNNPKYLDFYITAAIENGEWYGAEGAIDRLREVNPDNKKIPLFEENLRSARQGATHGKEETK